MYELYFLVAILTNVIADLMIWHEVKIMRMSHQLIRGETEDMKLLIEQCALDIKPLLNDHADRLAKGLKGAIGHYQGKAEKAAQEQIGSLDATLGGLGEVIKIVNNIAPDSTGKGNSKFML